MNTFIHEYSGLEEAAWYFLTRSYNDLYDAMSYERASKLFERLIDKIDLPEDWEWPELPESRLALINESQDFIPEETTQALAEAWNRAQRDSGSDGPLLGMNQTLSSVSVAGHVMNLFVCVESVANRSLIYRREEGSISDDECKAMDRADVIPKIMYLFKEDFSKKRLHLGHIRSLASMRNEAVHYRGRSRTNLKPKVKTLFDIGKEVGKLLDIAGGRPDSSDLGSLLYAATAPHLE